ncbi:hypothetical protein FRC01_012578 [Tulasnella sp. 417]|nr:hypothetical protein FRC01_012578 [Tulasnella sp. 417]
MPPYAQPHSPMAPMSGPVPLMPNPHLMRQGLPPSPGPLAGSWHGSGGYFMPGPVPPPHPQWIGAQNSPRSGTPSGGRATPPVQAMYPGYFGPPPPMNYPYGPVPPPPMQQHSPSPSYVNGRRSSVNSSPLQSRTRKNITNESALGAGVAEDGGDDGDQDRLAGITDALVESTFEDSEGLKAASTSNDRSSRGTLEAASETGGGESEKGDVFGSTSIKEEPPSARTA